MKKQRQQSELGLPTEEQLKTELKRIRHTAAYGKALRSTVGVLLVVAAVAVLISSLFLPVLQIAGDSMTPTLNNDEIVVLVKTNHFDTGDLCSFSWNNKILIKRIIAGPGDWVEIDGDGTIYVNGEALEEPYVMDKSLGECDLKFPIQIGENEYFLVGDHRSTSVDSRSTVIGNVSTEQIIGKVVFRIWPFGRIGFISEK